MPGNEDGAGRMSAEPLSMAEVDSKVMDKGLEEELKRGARSVKRASLVSVQMQVRLGKTSEELSHAHHNAHISGSVKAQIKDLETQLQGREKAWNIFLDAVTKAGSILSDATVEGWYRVYDHVSEASDDVLTRARVALGESDAARELAGAANAAGQGAVGGGQNQGSGQERLVVWKESMAKKPKEGLEVDSSCETFEVFQRRFRMYMKNEDGMRPPTNMTCYGALYDLLSTALAARMERQLSEEKTMDQNLEVLARFYERENPLVARRIQFFKQSKLPAEDDEQYFERIDNLARDIKILDMSVEQIRVLMLMAGFSHEYREHTLLNDTPESMTLVELKQSVMAFVSAKKVAK